jgi:hypothetical protein
MEPLLDQLRARSRTLTLYNYRGSEAGLETLASELASRSIAVRTAEDPGGPANVCLLHREGEVLGAVSLSELAPEIAAGEDGVAAGFEGGGIDTSVLPVDAGRVTISPETERRRLVAVSREIERTALRAGTGKLRAGFQRLSVLAGSERTRSVYRRLAETGVDVRVFGTPDADVSDAEFEVVADEDETFAEFWFLLYDGGGDPGRRAALVAREDEPDLYDSFWTRDPETVEQLIAEATERWPALA